MQAEALDDVLAREFIRRGGERDARHIGKRSCSCELQILGPEVVPHWLTQCASSMAKRLKSPRSCSEVSWARKRGVVMRSGAAYSSARRPLIISRSTCAASSLLWLELRKAACTPASSSAPTWSCISAMSGLTTTVTPWRRWWRRMAGTW